jgi:hypothetical protein
MIEAMVEIAALTQHLSIKIPNSTLLMRDFSDQLIQNPSFRDIEVIADIKDDRHDTFCLRDYKALDLQRA